ncbi:uncharacterized protein [Watersipora subatra]|uniref:uncharacterized protein n=1 Tax=Watersipora subatra TaxID=2589382 RepID=UPI00355C4774
MAFRKVTLVLLIILGSTLDSYCTELLNPVNILPKHTYNCSEQFSISLEAPEIGEDAQVCLKSSSESKTFKEAQKACKDSNAYLINHDLQSIDHLISNLSDYTKKLSIYYTIRRGEYWTGLHYDGQGLFWDGDLPTNPKLNIQCGNKSLVREKGSAWFCDELEQWENPGTDVCVAAKYNYEEDEKVKLLLRNCSEKKGRICAGYFTSETFALMEESQRCEPGWLWNAYTGLCIKVFNTTVTYQEGCAAAPKDSSATFFNIDLAEGRALFQSLATHPSFQPYQGVTLRVGPWQMEVQYAFDSQIYLKSQSSSEAAEHLPHICQMPEKPISESMDFSVKLIVDSSGDNSTLRCLANSAKLDSSVPHSFLIPNGEIKTAVSLDSPLSYDQGGDYRCIVYNRDTSEYSYSPVTHVNQGGALYYATVQLPLNLTYEQWQSMVRYYPELNSKSTSPYTVYEILSEVTSILQESFEVSIAEITQVPQCVACSLSNLTSDAEMKVLRLTDVRPSNGSILVKADIVYYTTNENGLRTILEQDWDFLTAHIRRDLAERNSLGVFDDMTFLDFDGSEMGVKWNSSQLANRLTTITTLPTTVQTVAPTEKCSETKMNITELEATVEFPAAPEGSDFSTPTLCPNSASKPLAMGKCENGSWHLISSCIIENVTETTKALLNIALETENIVDSASAISALKKTADLINSTLDANEVSLVTDILVNSANTSIENVTVLNEVYTLTFETLDNLLDTEEDTFKEAQNSSNTSERIISVLYDLIHKPLPLDVLSQSESGDIFETTKPNIAFKLSTNDSLIGVVSFTEDITPESIDYVNLKETQGIMGGEALASLMLEGLGKLGDGKRRAFVTYKDDKLHKAVGTGVKSAGRILSATITELNGDAMKLREIPGLVRILYPYGAEDINSTAGTLACGYWKPETSEWSTAGCSLKKFNQTGITCVCDHLTDFSAIFQTHVAVNKSNPSIQIYQDVLETVTYVGLVTSNICLLCVISTFIMFKTLRKTNSQKVLVCLSISILGLNISFLIGSQLTKHKIPCTVVSVCIHYFLLSVFAWMCVQGVLQYLKFVKVIGVYIPRFMRKATIPAVLGPALIVTVTLIVSSVTGGDYYFPGRADLCWMRMDMIYYAVFIPIGAVLIINIAIFVRVLVAFVSSRKRMSALSATNRPTAILHLKASVAIFIVLGLTWLFGFLSIIRGDASQVFQFLFCTLNAFQGFLIFVFHHIREPKVQAAWAQLFKGCQVRRKASFSRKPHEKEVENQVSSKLVSDSDRDRTESSNSTESSDVTDSFISSTPPKYSRESSKSFSLLCL